LLSMTLFRTDRITALLTATAVAIVIAFVACPGGHKSSPAQATLVSVALTPTNPPIALRTAPQVSATGTYSNGTTVDLTTLAHWSSSEATAGDMSTASPGQATALGLGSTTITATYSGRSGSTTLTVSGAALVSIEVTPTNAQLALGTSGQ